MLFSNAPRREARTRQFLARKGFSAESPVQIDGIMSDRFMDVPRRLAAFRLVSATSTKEQADDLAVQAAFPGNKFSLKLLRSAINTKPEYRETFMEGLRDIAETSPYPTIRYKALMLLLDYAICGDNQLAADARYEIGKLKKVDDLGYGSIKAIIDSQKFDLSETLKFCVDFASYGFVKTVARIFYIGDLFLGLNGGIDFTTYLGAGVLSATTIAIFYHVGATKHTVEQKLNLLQ